MKRSWFSEEQIVAILKEQEAGMATAEVCCRHGISPSTFYNWKSKFGGMDVSEAKQLRALGEKNAKLKKLLGETMLDNAILKDLAGKRWLRPAQSGMQLRGWWSGSASASPRTDWGACDVVGARRRVARYCSTRPDDSPLRPRLCELAAERRRFGYRRLGYLLAREGMAPNHKKLLRI